MNERAVLFGSTHTLVGVVTYPDGSHIDTERPALIILNAGVVHRVGPQRFHVNLARRVAGQGFVAIRFDFSGIGDSPARADLLPYNESAILEVREVMDSISELTGIQRFCVTGLSSGGVVSLLAALKDPRVVGVGILNPAFEVSDDWGKHVESRSVSRIYLQNFLKADSWRKFLTGKTNYRRMASALWQRLSHLGRRVEAVESVVEGINPTLTAFLACNIQILFLFSQKDRSIDHIEEVLGPRWQKRAGAHVTTVLIPDANHTFSSPVHLKQAVEEIEIWMKRCWPPKPAALGIGPT